MQDVNFTAWWDEEGDWPVLRYARHEPPQFSPDVTRRIREGLIERILVIIAEQTPEDTDRFGESRQQYLLQLTRAKDADDFQQPADDRQIQEQQ